VAKQAQHGLPSHCRTRHGLGGRGEAEGAASPTLPALRQQPAPAAPSSNLLAFWGGVFGLGITPPPPLAPGVPHIGKNPNMPSDAQNWPVLRDLSSRLGWYSGGGDRGMGRILEGLSPSLTAHHLLLPRCHWPMACKCSRCVSCYRVSFDTPHMVWALHAMRNMCRSCSCGLARMVQGARPGPRSLA